MAGAESSWSAVEEWAAVKVQAAARGLLARRAVRAVAEAEREAMNALLPRVAAVLVGEAGATGGKAKLAVAEEPMRLLLRLDAVRGARAYRRRVVAKVLALQDALDSGVN
uniref:BAG domain-containing protein n=1 Tax=Leersia perrieri TaxID=77586 RepID=A0A0D9XSC6_9ORYZ